MSDESDGLYGPFPTPTRTEQRGEFPEHSDRPPRPLLSGPEAKKRARERLENWRKENG